MNPDCVRDILLSVGEETRSGNTAYFTAEELQKRHNRLNGYKVEELERHISRCVNSGYFVDPRENIIGQRMINGLSQSGLAFLRDIM